MKILGYSERGFINALLYEIAYREPEQSTDLIKKLFTLVKWPMDVPPTDQFDNCETVLVEQSFADFGDADALFLFSSNTAVFFEGKVGRDYTLKQAWNKFIGAFLSQARQKGLTSNLFCQLYFKQRLVSALEPTSTQDMDEGLSFDPPFNLVGRNRKIGDNGVVQTAVTMVQRHLRDVRYLLMVPEPWTDEVKAWWCREVAQASSSPTGWDLSHWGIISIPDIVRFCRENGLTRTLDVATHNAGQLYVQRETEGSAELIDWMNRHGKRGVAVIYVPAINPNTSLHFSWVGGSCALRDYSSATSFTTPKPIRLPTAAVLPGLKRPPHFEHTIDIGRVAKWREIIERQNVVWMIGTKESS